MKRHGNVWVCVDCYFAHHYGATEHDGQWFAGESDTPCDREPLALLEGLELARHLAAHRLEKITADSVTAAETARLYPDQT